MTEPNLIQFTIAVPLELGREVSAALRARYPEVTADAVSDADVARRVFAWLVSSILADDVADRVRKNGRTELALAEQQLDERVKAARSEAWSKVQKVVLPPDAPAAPAAPTAPDVLSVNNVTSTRQKGTNNGSDA